MQEIEIREVESGDIDRLIELFSLFHLEFVGLDSRSIYRAVLKDAVKRNHVCIVVGAVDGNIAGWSIAIINSRRYWVRFLSSHPWLGFMVVWRRVSHRISNRFQETESVDTNNHVDHVPQELDLLDHQWGASAKNVARHLNVSVSEQYRRLGIASKIYQFQMQILLNYGVRWFDAYILKGNLESIKLHKKLGWKTVRQDRTMWFLTKELLSQS